MNKDVQPTSYNHQEKEQILTEPGSTAVSQVQTKRTVGKSLKGQKKSLKPSQKYK